MHWSFLENSLLKELENCREKWNVVEKSGRTLSLARAYRLMK
jgi:hypothetical protein